MPRDDDIFVDALEIPEAERAAFFARACAGDSVQQARVEALLRGHGRAGAYFDTTSTSAIGDEKAGGMIGRYLLLERIGEGGCGVVWMAEQSEPVRRRVALKVIKLGMDTREVIARFEAERQALALMDHPNIAKVFDAGTTDAGRPFFVMELVRGISITRFCDEATLATHERLQLFISVCHAIQHAHQKGIIHRDIKPSNILVTLHDDVAVPVVIDFGIAKATQGRLTDRTVFTAFEQFIGTPAYMSPEQAEFNALDVDTRSDVYSLGVLLYELLTGGPPFDPKTLVAGGLDQIRRVIREVDPPRPSLRLNTLGQPERITLAQRRRITPAQLSILTKGDLDWIVMRCLEKNRARRYETVNALATDLQRHLRHEPVAARPPSRGYLLQKLIQRHRGAFGAAAAIVAVLILGAAISTWQAIRAMRGEQEQSRLRVVESDLRTRAEAQALAMRRQSYASDMNLAQQSLAGGNLARPRELLNRHRPKPGEIDLRGWEWRYLWGRSRGQEIFSFRPGSGVASCVVFSPDGTTFATAGGQQPVQVWATSTRARLASLSIPGTGVQSNNLAFSPDWRQLAACSKGTVVVWDTATWRELVRLPGIERNEYSQPVVFSPDSNSLAVLSGHEIQFWDTRVWQRQGVVKPENIAHGLFCLSADWRWLVTGGPQRAEVWDRARASKVAEIPGWVVALNFTPDGRLLAVGNYEGNVLLWDPAAKREVSRWKAHRSAVRSVSFSPDGKLLATGGEDHAIHFWDLATRQQVSSRSGHQRPVGGISFSPDGRTLASASADGTVQFWSAGEAAAPDELSRSSEPLWFSRDGRTLATLGTDYSVQYWEADTRHLIRAVPLPATESGVLNVRMAGDGKTVAIPRANGTIELWDSDMRQSVATLIDHEGTTVETLAFSPDQRWLAAVHRQREGAPRNELIIWNLATHRMAARFPRVGTVIAFSPDGRRLALRQGYTIQLLDTSMLGTEGATLRIVKSLSPAGAGSIYAVAFSPDGQRLAAGGRDFAARIWDVTSGQHLADTAGHVGGVFSIAFTPDGRTFATGSVDGTAKFWDTATWQELMTVVDYGKPVTRLVFSPDGTTIAVGSAAADDQHGPVQLWRAPPWSEIEASERQ